MSANVSYATYDLGYPPWALDFDPYNRGYLLVGGGGGEGQKEVPNRLTLLDISARGKVQKAAELDVTEDSPVSLGVLSTKDGLYAFSGINSGAADRKTGKNEHLRSFKVDYPTRTKAGKTKDGNISPLSQATLFAPSYAKSDDAYQRLLRLSPVQVRAAGNKRVGVIASSLAEESEIVVFDATNAAPTTKDVIYRIEPLRNAEANDVDVIEVANGAFRLAYVTNTELFLTDVVYDFGKKKVQGKVNEPTSLHQAHAAAGVPRTRYRSLRFLSPEHILILSNIGSVSELLIVRHYPKGGPADVVLRKRLPKGLGAAVSMDASLLDADPKSGVRQAVIAVAAQSQDVMVYTIDIPAKGSPKSILTYKELKGSHSAPMKKVVLSPFVSPYALAAAGASKKPLDSSKPSRQYLRLASISLSNSLVVDDLPLQTVSSSDRKRPRYILGGSGPLADILHRSTNVFIIGFILLISLLLVQSLIDAYAAEQGKAPAVQMIPSGVRQWMASFREDSDPLKAAIHAVHSSVSEGQKLRDLIDAHHEENTPVEEQKKAIVIRLPGEKGTEIGSNTVLSTEVYHDTAAVVADEKTKSWHELSRREKETWKKRLTDAGAWTVDEGETVLKSIFFSEVAGAVGRAAMEAIRA